MAGRGGLAEEGWREGGEEDAAGGAEEVLVPGRLHGWELRSGFAVLGWVAGEVEAGRVGQGSGHHKG